MKIINFSMETNFPNISGMGPHGPKWAHLGPHGPTGVGPGPRRLPVGSRHSLDLGGSGGGAEPPQEEQSGFFVLLRYLRPF